MQSGAEWYVYHRVDSGYGDQAARLTWTDRGMRVSVVEEAALRPMRRQVSEVRNPAGGPGADGLYVSADGRNWELVLEQDYQSEWDFADVVESVEVLRPEEGHGAEGQ